MDDALSTKVDSDRVKESVGDEIREGEDEICLS